MKKLALTLAIVLGLGMASYAQGLFNRGYEGPKDDATLPGLPSQHGLTDNQSAPLGSGALMLIGFGAAYVLTKRNKK